jgi:predicted transposase YbfD/YdcC
MSPQGHNLTQHFITITDPRIDRTKLHSLIDIIMIAICAVIAGCEGWIEIADFGEDKEPWLRTFLALPNGTPSHDTFGRVFSLLDPKQFQASFADWMQSVVTLTKGEIIAIDGKTNRRTFGGKGGTRALHLVSAFATANGVALGQVDTNQKSNEITAIPELLKLLDIQGCLVTTDAMGCQADIAAEILGKDADYLLAVKGNQGLLYRDMKAVFADASIERDTNVSENKGHGRIEKRTCEVMSGPEIIARLRHKNNWVGLKTIVKVTSERTVKPKVGTAAYKSGTPATSTESRYYICSIEEPSAERMQQAVRAHWKVENSLHWVLDMQMREDESRIRTDHAPANMSVLRHIALNIVRSDKDRRIGIKASRLKAGRNDAYLKKLLGF